MAQPVVVTLVWSTLVFIHFGWLPVKFDSLQMALCYLYPL